MKKLYMLAVLVVFGHAAAFAADNAEAAKTSAEMNTAKLEMVGLSIDDGHKFPSELSGGMTKRAALAERILASVRVPEGADTFAPAEQPSAPPAPAGPVPAGVGAGAL